MRLADRLRAALAREQRELLIGGDDNAPVPGRPVPVPAAVLVAVTDRAEPGLILTVRHAGLRAHAGQVAFPGGRIDPDDRDATAAALREAEEEIALPPLSADVIGPLDPFLTITDYLVTPVLAVVPPDLPLSPRAGEVSDLFEPPLAHLLDPRHRQERAGDFHGRTRRFYEIEWQGRRVWGATAAMIVNLAARLGAGW